jgi:hypothetical protein
MKRLIAACPVLMLVAAAPALACVADPIDWITDIRRCTASYSGDGAGSSWQDRPTAFDTFQDGGADILVTNGIETWSATCSQDSTMDGVSASFEATSHATIMAGLMSNPLLAQAQSKFDLYFTITEAVAYELEGQVSETLHPDSLAVLRLSLVGGDEIGAATSGQDSTRSFQMSGILEPGTYRLYAEALGKCRTLPMTVFAEGGASCRMSFSASAAPGTPPPPERPRTTSSTDSPPPRQ